MILRRPARRDLRFATGLVLLANMIQHALYASALVSVSSGPLAAPSARAPKLVSTRVGNL